MKILDCIEIILFVVSFIYIISLLGFVTKKRFIGPCSVRKNILLVLFSVFLSPLSIYLGARELMVPERALFRHFNIYEMMGAYYREFNNIVNMANELILLTLVILLYVKFCGRKNRSLSIFVYLMIHILTLVFFSAIFFSTTKSILLITLISIALYTIYVLFYLFVVKPMLSINTEGRNVDQPVFIYLPIVTIVFTRVLYYITFLVDYNGTGIITEKKTIEILNIIILIFILFIAFLLIVAFNVILRNVSQIHETLHQKDVAEKTKDELKELSVEVMEALAHTIDAKDEYTKGHSIRVANYSKMIAQKMDMSEEDCENVYYMGLLHDIGKIGVPNAIINKTTGLNDEEYRIIQKHPPLGYDILSEIKSRPDLSIGARWHHERYDGKGYPDRKKSDEIPLFARIIAVADCYDAMTSNRSYRQYLPQDVVREEIIKNMGTQFDPEIAKYMIEIIDSDHEYVLHE